jgi:NAD(P)H-flavin reductase
MTYDAELVARAPAGGGMSLLGLRGAPELHATYTRPGQYTEIDLGGEQAFFAIASRVGAGEWELVLKGGGASADTLLGLPLGAKVPVSAALGHGFPCDEVRGRALLMAVNGSGIAAARPVVSARIDDGDASRTELYVGARARGELPLTAEMADWSSHGVRVVLCLSQDPEAPRPFERGYVQDIAEKRADGEVLRGGMIFAVGAQGMTERFRALAPRVGIAPKDVRTNY